MRTIQIISTRGNNTPITTSATTLNDILPELRSRGVNINDNTLIVRETRAELSMGEALLPTGDFSLFIYPKKNKSGAIEEQMEQLNHNIERLLNALSQKPFEKEPVEVDPVMQEFKALAESLGHFDDEEEDEDY